MMIPWLLFRVSVKTAAMWQLAEFAQQKSLSNRILMRGHLKYAMQVSLVPNTTHFISSFPTLRIKWAVNKSIVSKKLHWKLFLKKILALEVFGHLLFVLFLGFRSCPSRQQHSLGHTKPFPLHMMVAAKKNTFFLGQTLPACRVRVWSEIKCCLSLGEQKAKKLGIVFGRMWVETGFHWLSYGGI